ncbi:MAG: hypothetical protein WEB93_03145 [Sphingomonadales bacterium]
MESLIRGLVSLAQAGNAVHSLPSFKQASGAVLCAVVAAAALVAALGAAMSALWLFLLPLLGPALTALVMAVLFALIALVLVAFANHLMHPESQSEPEENPLDPQPEIDAMITEGLRLYRENKGLVLTAALVAGLAKGSGKGTGKGSGRRR